MSNRRFPPPWSMEELEACFVVKDGGQRLNKISPIAGMVSRPTIAMGNFVPTESVNGRPPIAR
jgi:hypothetical protein